MGATYIGLRTARTIIALPSDLSGGGEAVLPRAIVPFPRGFAFGLDGRLYLASGTSPFGDGEDHPLPFRPIWCSRERALLTTTN